LLFKLVLRLLSAADRIIVGASTIIWESLIGWLVSALELEITDRSDPSEPLEPN